MGGGSLGYSARTRSLGLDVGYRPMSLRVISDLRSRRFQLLQISHRASQTNVQWKMTTV